MIKEVKESPIRKLSVVAEEREKRGTKVFRLNIGQPDFAFGAKQAKAVLEDSDGLMPYTPSNGMASLRSALSAFYKRTYAHDFLSEEIIVTSGASESIWILFQLLLSKNDEVLTMVPGYANYFSYLDLMNIRAKGIQQRSENIAVSFRNKISERTKLFLICNPNNPTGYVYKKSEIEALIELAREKNIWIIFDEVYRDFVFEGAHISGCNYLDDYDKIVIVDSMSKRFASCGLRIGWLVSKNQELLRAAKKVTDIRLSTSNISQILSEDLLKNDGAIIQKSKNLLLERRSLTLSTLHENFDVFEPFGAFYYYFKLPKEISDSNDFCSWLIRDFEYDGMTLLLAPGGGFYISDVTVNEVRMTLLKSSKDLKKAIEILLIALKEYPGGAK